MSFVSLFEGDRRYLLLLSTNRRSIKTVIHLFEGKACFNFQWIHYTFLPLFESKGWWLFFYFSWSITPFYLFLRARYVCLYFHWIHYAILPLFKVKGWRLFFYFQRITRACLPFFLRAKAGDSSSIFSALRAHVYLFLRAKAGDSGSMTGITFLSGTPVCFSSIFLSARCVMSLAPINVVVPKYRHFNLHVRTQYSVDPGHPPPYLILLASRFQIYLPFWTKIIYGQPFFLNFENLRPLFGQKNKTVSKIKNAWWDCLIRRKMRIKKSI